MPFVISNTTPVINFAQIGLLHVLRELFGQVMLPEIVVEELRAKEELFPLVAPALRESFFIQKQVPVFEKGLSFVTSNIHPGETACITLALQNPGSLVILDDVEAREWALANGLNVIGTLGCLLVAKEKKMVAAVAPLLDELQTKARFWMADSLRAHVLRRAAEG